MKNCLIVNDHMKIGGIKNSLLELIPKLQQMGYSVDLLILNREQDAAIKQLAQSGVTILYGPTLLDVLKKPLSMQTGFPNRLKKLFIGSLSKLLGRGIVSDLIILQSKRNSKHYDAAISYFHSSWSKGLRNNTGGACEYYVRKKVNAEKKIAWLHSDPNCLGYTTKRCIAAYMDFDVIVHVSNGCRSHFEQIAPEFKTRSKVVYNYIDANRITHLAREAITAFDTSIINILTVARLDNKTKRIDRIIDCCVTLKENWSQKFCWRIVGGGEDFYELKRLAVEKGVDHLLIFEGLKANPYPYLVNSDLLVSASDYEGFGISTMEAVILGIPVVSTKVTPAPEMITPDRGKIADFSASSLAESIMNLLDDTVEYQRIKTELKKNIWDDTLFFKQLQEVLE